MIWLHSVPARIPQRRCTGSSAGRKGGSREVGHRPWRRPRLRGMYDAGQPPNRPKCCYLPSEPANRPNTMLLTVAKVLLEKPRLGLNAACRTSNVLEVTAPSKCSWVFFYMRRQSAPRNEPKTKAPHLGPSSSWIGKPQAAVGEARTPRRRLPGAGFDPGPSVCWYRVFWGTWGLEL